MTTPPPGASIADLAAVARQVLTLAAAAIGDTAPDRQYVSAGLPVWDFGFCAQLTVYPGIVSPGLPGATTANAPDRSPDRSGGRSYAMTVELARCQPVIEGNSPPPADVLDEHGATMFADMQTLDRFVRSLGVNSKVTPSLAQLGVREVAPGIVSTVNAQGGMAAVRATLTVVC